MAVSGRGLYWQRHLERQRSASGVAGLSLVCATALILLPKGFAAFGALLAVMTLLVPDLLADAWTDAGHVLRSVALLAVLFLAELLGVAGAVVAVPAVAVAQIFVRELLAARRDRLSADASVLPPLFGPASSPTAPPPALVERPSSR